MISSPYIAKQVIDAGGSIHPLIIPSSLTNGLGLMNPSIFIDRQGTSEEKILINLRSVNYTFYHSEKKLFQHPYGPLTYLHPENDIHLRTANYYLELDDNLKIQRYNKVDTSKLDVEPLWDFVGLEDARIFRWNEKLYLSGVRRDTTTNGQGRMELSEIIVEEDSVKEISRFRIPAPNNPNSYCEKNWMPILDLPYHYVKWSNPTEIVKVDPVAGTCETVKLGNYNSKLPEFRGGSSVAKWNGNYIAITHTVDLFNSEEGRKDAVYRHYFLMWDKDWNLIKCSRDFSLLDGHVEFAVGLVPYKNNFLITFGFQDNAAYLLSMPKNLMESFLYDSN